MCLVLAAVLAWHVPRYLAGPEPVGDDSSSHILAAARVAEHLRTGSGGWWMPDLNLGFPLAHFYQPLPHVATGALALALGGPEHAASAYKLCVVLLLLVAPLAATLGFRRFGLSWLGATCGALALAALSAPKAFYGLTTRHYLLGGLYTLLWGAVFVPLALGEGVRYLQGRGKLALACGAFALLFLSHALLALGLALVFAFTALGGADGALSPRARLTRLVLLGGSTGILIAFWLLPQLACSDYFGGWPISKDERADGFGLGPLLADWMRGQFTDLRRAPVIAYLALCGCVVALVRARQATSRIVLFGVVLFVVFSAGRKTFGSTVDWVFPPNTRIEGLMRCIAMLHLFLALACGLAVEYLLERVAHGPRWLARGGRAALPIALVALLAPGYFGDVRWGLDTFPEAQDRPAYLRMAEALRAAPTPGRVYTAEPVGQVTHWCMAYLGLLAQKPMSLSYGVGVQDSLNFLYLWSFGGDRPRVLVRDRARAAAVAELFDVRYVLTRPGFFDLGFLGARTLVTSGPYQVLELPGEYGYFDVIDPPELLPEAPPAQLRTRLERWLRAEYPRGARFLRLPEPVHAKSPSLPTATLQFREEQAGGVDDAPVLRSPAKLGHVLSEDAGSNRYHARVAVDADEAWLLLKVTPHPWWHAEVDGIEAPVYYLSPAFQGLSLRAGKHEVTFTFENPRWQGLLLGLAPLFWLGLLAFERWRGRAGA